ncbi:MAG: hypothetical protein ABII18_06640 [bacterium]
MTYLSIDAKAQPIVDRVLERAADENCENDLNFLFSVASWSDGNYTLISEEAKTVEELLDAQAGPRRIVLFGGCNDNGPAAPLYEQSHIATALKDVLKTPASDDSVALLLSVTSVIESRIIQSLMIDIINRNSKMHAIFVSDRPEAQEFFQLINEISKLPNFDLSILISYIEELWPFLEHGLWFKDTPDQIQEHFQGMDYSHYIDSYYERMVLAATAMYQRYEHEQKYLPDIQSYCDDKDYLYTLIDETDNAHTKAEALRCLAEMEEGAEILMAEIESTQMSLDVTDKYYKILSLFGDPEITTWLLDRLGHVSFMEQNLVIEAFLFLPDHNDLVSQLMQKSRSENVQEQAIAFAVLTSIMSTTPFERREEIIQAALSQARNEKAPTLVRVAALSVLGAQYNLDLVKPLEELTQNTNPEISSMATRILSKVSSLRVGASFDIQQVSHITQTAIFRNPRQIDWIYSLTKYKATQWQPGDDPITILDVGGSYGAEAVSILLFILDEYRKNPVGWGHFNPHENLKIVTTDIEVRALVFSETAAFANRQDLNSSEFGPLDVVVKMLGFSTDDYKAYFDISDDDVWILKEPYRNMIETRYMDITDCDKYLETYGPSDIVVYNQADPYLAQNQRAPAAENVIALSKQFIATSPMRQETFDTFATQTNLSEMAGSLMLFEKPTTQP